MTKLCFAFHVHTNFSKDSSNKPRDIVHYCRRHQIDAIAICDHNEIAGAQEVAKIAGQDVKVIIGEEIATTEGEILGLFLKKRIQPGLVPKETISEIRAQGGLVCIPHPGESLRREAMSQESIAEIIDDIDLLESFNARVILSRDRKMSEHLAKKFAKPTLIGSDAHFLAQIGQSLGEISPFATASDFISVVSNGGYQVLKYRKTNFLAHLASKIVKMSKLFH